MKNKTKNHIILRILLLFVIMCLFGNMTIYSQVRYQNIVDEISKKLNGFQAQIYNIKKVQTSIEPASSDDIGQLKVIEKSINKLENIIDNLSSDPPESSLLESQLLGYLFNIEENLEKLVAIKLEEKVVTEVIATTSNYETFPDESESSPMDFRIGADFVSRYVWRGTDFGDSPSIQPYISFSYFGIELGAWASYPFSAISSDNNELDLNLSYALETAAGNFGVAFTDYYFANAGIRFLNWEARGNGAHTIEFAFTYSNSKFPLSLLTAYNIHNDPDNSLYVELGYSTKVANSPISIFIAGTKGKSSWYGITTNKFEIINSGITVSKKIKFSDSFSLPVYASYIFNPYAGKTFLVFGISI